MTRARVMGSTSRPPRERGVHMRNNPVSYNASRTGRDRRRSRSASPLCSRITGAMRRAASMSVVSALVFIASSSMRARLMFIWKACHHAKIAAAAHSPEAVGILAGAGFQELPVGGDDIDRQELVTAQTVRAHDPAGGSLAKCPRLAIAFAPGDAPFGACGARCGIDMHARHGRYIDHEAIVAYGIAGHIGAIPGNNWPHT